MADPCGKEPVIASIANTLLSDSIQPEVPWDLASLGSSQLGQWWAPVPGGGLSQLESVVCESELTVMGNEPGNGKKLFNWGQSWYCGRLKLYSSYFLKKAKQFYFILL